MTTTELLRFGRLEVIGKAPRRKGQSYMLCRCDCGKEKEIALCSLRTDATTSCGCYRNEVVKWRSVTHGKSETNAYNTWLAMRQRCLNPSNPAYPSYGGRGITIDEAWDTFEGFLRDMGEPPTGKSLDRIDNAKGYGPHNCRWATRIEQNRNTRSCKYISYKEETKTISEWAEQYGIGVSTLSQRIRLGWDIERALTQPTSTYHKRDK